MQAAAQAYGERMVLEQTLAAIEKVDDSLQPVLKPLASLFAISCIEDDLGWIVSEGLLSPAKGVKVGEIARKLCKDIAPNAWHNRSSVSRTHALLTQGVLVGYNAYDNQGDF